MIYRSKLSNNQSILDLKPTSNLNEFIFATKSGILFGHIDFDVGSSALQFTEKPKECYLKGKVIQCVQECAQNQIAACEDEKQLIHLINRSIETSGMGILSKSSKKSHVKI